MSRSLYHVARAIVLLTAAMVRRMIREGMVRRSLIFPVGLTVGTLMATVAVAAWLNTPPVVTVTPALEAEGFTEILVEYGFNPMVTPDPQAPVASGAAWAGTDGAEIWQAGSGPLVMVFESLVRQRVDAPWRPVAIKQLPDGGLAAMMGGRIVLLLGGLFSLYGVVFGVGMVARDRDSGLLEVELSLPVPHWVHGFVRLATATLGLGTFLSMGIILVGAVIGVPDTAALVRHAFACAAGSTSIGLLVIGRAGLKRGFAGPFATGMTLATGLFVTGLSSPTIGKWLPLASFTTDSSGWEALVGATVLGILTVLVFSWRTAKA